jgi:hypothetical protein
MGTKVYFFSGPTYFRYDRVDDKVDDGYPLPIAGNWSGLAEDGVADRIDAAINWGDGKLYLFRDNRYVRYDIAMDRADDGYPLAIAGYWPGFAEAGFASSVDAAVNWGNGKAYFFSGSQYLRYDIKKDRVDPGYPLAIAGNWPGVSEAGFTGIDAVSAWGDGKVYFFKGGQYLRYDIKADRVDDGYPLPITGNWPGLTAPSGGRLSGAVDLFVPTNRELWLEGADIVRSPVNGPAFLPFPWRGVLHTTEGNTIQAAIDEFRKNNNDFPHFTIDPNAGKIVQHISLSVGSRALGDKGVAANAAHAIQIEMVGLAKDTPTWGAGKLAFVRSVMRQIEGLVPVPQRSGLQFLDAAGVNHNPKNRMNAGQWASFSGWCGHQHVPGDNHWDPGAIDIDTLVKN